MKRNLYITLLALSLGLSPSLVSAGEQASGDNIGVKTLAEISGLSQRQVCMLLHARTPYAESRYAFDRIEAKFVNAIGERQYRQLLAGEPVRFERQIDGRPVAVIVALKPNS